MAHYGVDVSSNNVHPINWPAVVAYLTALGDGAAPFVIVKVSQGTGYLNPDMAVDVASARAAGIQAEAGYLMDQGNSDIGGELALYKAHSNLPMADDIELPEGLSVAQYVAHSRPLINLDPTALDYYNQAEVGEGFASDPATLWLAQYNGQPGAVKFPCVMHQFSDNAVIPGTSGVFDLNVWLGSEAGFDSYFRQIATTATPTTTSGERKMLAATFTGKGYWILKTDGSIWSFGDAPYLGGCNVGASAPFGPGDYAISLTSHPTGYGYWIESGDGATYAFGVSQYHGSLNNLTP